jgi:hypothetical protein
MKADERSRRERVAEDRSVRRGNAAPLDRRKAAKSVGISYITAWRWMKDPIVLGRLRTARRDVMNRVILRLQEAATGAVDCLCDVQKEDESESAE